MYDILKVGGKGFDRWEPSTNSFQKNYIKGEDEDEKENIHIQTGNTNI